MDLAPIIAKKAERFRELDNAIADPSLFDQPARARATLREHTQLKGLLDSWTAQVSRLRSCEKSDSMSELRNRETSNAAMTVRTAETARTTRGALAMNCVIQTVARADSVTGLGRVDSSLSSQLISGGIKKNAANQDSTMPTPPIIPN